MRSLAALWAVLFCVICASPGRELDNSRQKIDKSRPVSLGGERIPPRGFHEVGKPHRRRDSGLVETSNGRIPGGGAGTAGQSGLSPLTAWRGTLRHYKGASRSFADLCLGA